MLRIALALALAALATPAVAQDDRAGLALTLTQGGAALVEDQRRATLDDTTATVRLTGIAEGSVAGSIQVLGDSGRAVRQTRIGGGATLPALLDAHVGETITILRDRADGSTEELTARILRGAPEPVLEIDGKVTVGLPGRVLFPGLPADLPLDGAVDARIEGATPGAAVLTLRYLTHGLGWSADHAVILSTDRRSLDITTWATIDNRTGMAWPDARLALVAGDVNQARESPRPEMMQRALMASAPMADGGGGPERQAVGGYHLYRLPGAATLPRDATTQVALLRATGLPAEVILEDTGRSGAYHGGREAREDSHPAQILMLRNPAQGGADAPLPAGLVRAYGSDSAGNTVFLGEDAVAPVPVGEEARVTLGEAFDVTVERTTTDHQRLGRNVTETARRVTLRNAGATAATVRVIEPLPGDWEILEQSQDHEKLDATRAQWTVEVPAEGEATLTFRVRTTF